MYDSGDKDPMIAKISETFGVGSSRPLLVILNIQGQCKYIFNDEFTSEKIKQWLENYLSEKLTSIDFGN